MIPIDSGSTANRRRGGCGNVRRSWPSSPLPQTHRRTRNSFPFGSSSSFPCSIEPLIRRADRGCRRISCPPSVLLASPNEEAKSEGKDPILHSAGTTGAFRCQPLSFCPHSVPQARRCECEKKIYYEFSSCANWSISDSWLWKINSFTGGEQDYENCCLLVSKSLGETLTS